MTANTITAYKGFRPDMTCRGMQYTVGETHTHDGDVMVCQSGLHASLYPLDVLRHYSPHTSRFAVVQADNYVSSDDGDTKIAARTLPDGSRIYWVAADLCKADLTPDCEHRYKTTNLMLEYLLTPEEPRDSGFTLKDAACNLLHSMRYGWANKVDTELHLAEVHMSLPDYAFLLPVPEPADD